MLPEVEQHMAALEAAKETFRNAPECEGDEENHDLAKCRWNARDVAEDAAWAALSGSTDPLVRWIAQNCTNYPDEALEILMLLPASLEELEAYASGEGWCPTWRRYRDLAEAAGVLPVKATPVEVTA